LTELTNNVKIGGQADTIKFTYDDYDKVGNKEQMVVDGSDTHNYTYDNIYQLTDANYPGNAITQYYYDALGNRWKVDVNEASEITSYDSNSLNQYSRVGSQTDLDYDRNCNLIRYGNKHYSYDCENRLVDVNENNQNVASYAYDYRGRRVRKVVYGSPEVTTKYCYDGDQVIAEYEGSTLKRKFIYGPGIDEPVCMIDVADSNAYYYHYDGLGSVSALSDEDGNIIEKYRYDVFGAPRIYDADDVKIDASGVSNPYMFTARRFDEETGLYYYRSRYYFPGLGRFMSPDPVAMFLQMLSVRKSARGKIPGRYLSEQAVRYFLTYDPIGRWLQIHPAGRFLQNGRISFPTELNLYIYCLNNPIIYIDPYGLGIWSWIGRACSLTGGALLLKAAVAASAPAWVAPVGVGLFFFGVGNMLGDYIFGDDYISDPPGKGDTQKRSRRYEEEIDNYPVDDPTDPGSYYR